MGKFKRSQILILFLIVALLSLTPFLSTSIRSTHLYIVINILILTVGFEAGLLSAFSKAPVKVEICCSRGSSIFFISSEEDEVLKDEKEELAEQELSTKADTFISNFYKQLKMQREEI